MRISKIEEFVTKISGKSPEPPEIVTVLEKYHEAKKKMEEYIEEELDRLRIAFGTNFDEGDGEPVVRGWIPDGYRTPCEIFMYLGEKDRLHVDINIVKEEASYPDKRKVQLEVRLADLHFFVDLVVAKNLNTLVKTFFSTLPGVWRK